MMPTPTCHHRIRPRTGDTPVWPLVDLQQRSFETKEGDKRTVIELQVEEIGASLRYATAKVTKTHRGDSGPAESDQWSAAPPPDEPPYSDEPPF